MFWSRDYTFKKSKQELDILRKNVKAYLHIKERKMSDISDYLNAFDYFIGHSDKFDGATNTSYLASGIITNNSFVNIETSGANPSGLRGDADYSANITDLDYIQKVYVDNPQTLINTLNNCNSTQLDEIKTILGIV